MARGEYHSSVKLYEYAPGIFPRPVAWGTFDSEPTLSFFMSEFVQLMDEVFPSPADICPHLAAMHKASQADQCNPGMFGFEVNTCTGTVEHDNTWSASWEAFFATKLRDLFQKDKLVHGPSTDYDSIIPHLFGTVIPRLLRPLETGGNKIKPVLIHGDLWHCNSASQAKPGGPVLLFDPAGVYAHHEYELYEWRSSRYNFDQKYVAEYRRHFPPSEPSADADDRLALYTMAVDLVDSILYPDSTRYRQSTIETATRLIDKFPAETCPQPTTAGLGHPHTKTAPLLHRGAQGRRWSRARTASEARIGHVARKAHPALHQVMEASDVDALQWIV